MDHVSVVVEDLPAAVEFFVRLGLQVEGETGVEGSWVDAVVGLEGVRCDIAMVRTPDGHGRLELTKFHSPPAVRHGPSSQANALGFRNVMFAVDDLDDVVGRMRAAGVELIGEVVQYQDMYRLCYLRGPEGIIVALAEELAGDMAGDMAGDTAEPGGQGD